MNKNISAVLEYIQTSGDEKLDSSSPLESGILDSRCGRGCIPFMEGRNEISHHPALQAVLEGARPRQFFEKLLGGEILTFDYKWLRGVHREAFTGAHVDNVYMSRGTSLVRVRCKGEINQQRTPVVHHVDTAGGRHH